MHTDTRPMADDRSLVRRLNRGDQDALGEIYRTHKDRLLTMAAGLLSDRSLAEDCLQDVFLKLARDSVSLEVRTNLKSYLTSCILNRARDELRKSGREAAESPELIENRSDPGADSGERVEGREARARIRRALRCLPREQREAVVLHLQDGMTFRSIGELQSVSANTAASRYRYGVRKLQHLLNGREER